MNHLQAIKEYLTAGLSPVPIKIKDKYPSMLPGWRNYMKKAPTEQETALWGLYRNSQEYGCGIVCGEVSGNLEVIDFDNHLNNAEEVFNEYTSIPEVHSIISKGIVIETTPSGGYHLFYKCSKIESSQKLAKQQKTAVIETRGEGGLIVTAPTKGYEVVAGDLCNILTITEDERDTLIEYARSFNTQLTEPPVIHNKKDSQKEDIRPGDFYNENCAHEIAEVLKSAGWQHLSGKYWRRPGKKTGVSATLGHVAPDTFYCFTSNGDPFEENKAYKPFSVFAFLNHNRDFSAAARAVLSRYSEELGKYGGGSNPPQTPKPATPEIPATVQKVIEKGIFNIKKITLLDDENYIDFYSISDKGALKIEWGGMKRFLTRHGFFRYKSGDRYMFVRVIHNVADFVTLEDIQNYILDFLLKKEMEDIHNKLWNTDKLNEKKLQILDECEPLFIKDPENSSYVFFKNTAVHVTKLGKEVVSYQDLPGFVWKKQIITRDYSDLKEDVFDFCNFSEFCKRVSGEKFDRLRALMGAMGYLMHTYKDPAFPPVINFTDEASSDLGPSGGSGKGVIFQAISRIRNTIFVDGKNFDPKHPFALQRVSEDTDIIFFQDLDKRFDFEAFFSMVTDGMVIQKKYQGEKFIGYKDTPKIGLNANYQIKGDSESFERRLFDIEIHKYFSQKHSIIDEYGCRFFEDGWDCDEWNKFDNFMMYCLQFYLRNGLQKPEYVYVNVNKLVANTSEEFVKWANSLHANQRYNKTSLYERFKNESGDDTTKQRYFTRYLKVYAKHKNWEIVDRLGSGGTDIEFSGEPDKEPDPANALPF